MAAPEPGPGHRGGTGEVGIAERRRLRYHIQMKRSLPKLVVRRETIRALATLELTRVFGGGTALVDETDTCKVNCTVAAIVNPPADG
jgi:hypothetical protein